MEKKTTYVDTLAAPIPSLWITRAVEPPLDNTFFPKDNLEKVLQGLVILKNTLCSLLLGKGLEFCFGGSFRRPLIVKICEDILYLSL